VHLVLNNTAQVETAPRNAGGNKRHLLFQQDQTQNKKRHENRRESQGPEMNTCEEKLEDQDSRPSKDAQGLWWGEKLQMRLSDMFALAKAFRDLE
jgi:hypothetical protein